MRGSDEKERTENQKGRGNRDHQPDHVHPN